MYNSNNVHINGTQNLSLLISQTRQNCNYNITLLFVPFLSLRHWCSHHLLVRYMGHGYSLNNGGEGVRNQVGYRHKRLPLVYPYGGFENGLSGGSTIRNAGFGAVMFSF